MSEINHSERAHSALGASSAKRWFACPASIPLSEGVEQETSEAAERGTAAHELAEAVLVDGDQAIDHTGMIYNEFPVTTEMAEGVQVYVDEVRKRAGETGEVTVEQRFSLDWIDPELFGTNDCAIYSETGVLTILDYKNGRGIVEAVNNPQLLYYALGAARGIEVSEVRLVIVQPNADHPDGPVREWIVKPEKLVEFEKELIDKVAQVNTARVIADKYSMAEAGDHCTFCPAAGFCEKLRNKSLEVAKADFSEPVVEVKLPLAAAMTPEELSRAYEYSGMIENWIKSVKTYAESQAKEGVKIPNYKLVNRRSNRKWKDEKVVANEFGDLFGDDLFTKKLKTPAQLEKIIGKKEIASMVEKPNTGTQLVPEKDKRPAVLPTAIEDFMDI